MKRPMIDQLEDYPWSSYPAYIGKAQSPKWLERDSSYQILGSKQRFKAYAEFVKQGVDDDTAKFYGKGHIAAIFGDKEFQGWVYDELLPELAAEEKSRVIQPNTTLKEMTDLVAKKFQKNSGDLRKIVKGPSGRNEPRQIAMYLCQELTDETLIGIANYFNLTHAGSVSYITHKIRKRLIEDKEFRKVIEGFIYSITIKAT